MTKVKVCGIRRAEDIEIVNLTKPDYIGYVFAKSSRRYVSYETAGMLTKLLDESVTPVGVFVNESIQNVIYAVNNGFIKIAQLHGDEDENYINNLHQHNIKVIRAFKIQSSKDMEQVKKSSADYVLLDSGNGSGKTFDWSCIGDINRDFFLAGGLTSKNVADAVKKLKPYAVDASSCMEKDGFKDLIKMLDFITAARTT